MSDNEYDVNFGECRLGVIPYQGCSVLLPDKIPFDDAALTEPHARQLWLLHITL